MHATGIHPVPTVARLDPWSSIDAPCLTTGRESACRVSSGVTTTFQSTIVRASALVIGESSSVGVALREEHSVVIVRTSPANVVLEDRALSRQHARLTWRGDRADGLLAALDDAAES